MKERISQINLSIEEKQNRLKEKAERFFASITIPYGETLHQGNNTAKRKSTPPISYILYGVSALSTLGVIASDSKALCCGVALASAFGGYKLSKHTESSENKALNDSASTNISAIKNEVTLKVLESIKKITQEWEEFMELKQREIQRVIENSTLNDSEKDSLYSKVFIYEVIDISISEMCSMINKSADVATIKQTLSVCKEKVKSAIDNAAYKQTSKYNSLIS